MNSNSHVVTIHDNLAKDLGLEKDETYELYIQKLSPQPAYYLIIKDWTRVYFPKVLETGSTFTIRPKTIEDEPIKL